MFDPERNMLFKILNQLPLDSSPEYFMPFHIVSTDYQYVHNTLKTAYHSLFPISADLININCVIKRLQTLP